MAGGTFYVSYNADPGGNGTTPNLSSGDGTHAFNSQVAAINGTVGTLTEPLIIRLLASSGSERPDWDGFGGNSASNYILFTPHTPSDGHQGNVGQGYEIFDANGNVIDTYEPWTIMEGFTVRGGSPDWSCILFRTGADNGTFRRMILQGYNGQGNGTRTDGNADTSNFYAESCLVFNCLNTKGGINPGNVTSPLPWRNFTIVDCSIGFNAGAGAVARTIHNSVGNGCTNRDWFGGSAPFGLNTNTAASDGTAVGIDIVSQTITDADFVDPTNNNWRLAPGSVLIDGGNPAEMATLDITGTPFVTNDVGCYAVAGAGPTVGDVADQFNLSDSASVVARYQATVEDTMSHFDGLSGVGRYSRAVVDGMSQGDADAGIGRYVRAMDDNVEISDIIDALTDLLATITDQAQYSDSIVALATFIASIQDGMTLQDTIDAFTEAVGNVADGYEFAETLLAIRQRLALLTDNQTFTDHISGELAGSAFRSLTDSQVLTDAVAALASKLGLATDTQTLSDVLIGVVSASRALSDAFTYGDTIIASTDVVGYVLEVYNFSDSASAVKRLTSVVADAYVLSDTVNVQAFKLGAISDYVVWSDSVSYPALGGYLTAVISLRESMQAAVQIRGV